VGPTTCRAVGRQSHDRAAEDSFLPQVPSQRSRGDRGPDRQLRDVARLRALRDAIHGQPRVARSFVHTDAHERDGSLAPYPSVGFRMLGKSAAVLVIAHGLSSRRWARDGGMRQDGLSEGLR